MKNSVGGILNGVRVIEWCQFFAGPGASAFLGDMGAEVISIERPGDGGPTRTTETLGGADFSIPGGRNALFESVGRNKKSIAVDMNSPEGREVVGRLVATADVFHTSFREGALQRKGMSYADLRKVNRDIVYSKLSGYGPEGPLSDLGAFDFIIQGFSGMMWSMGDEDSPGMAAPVNLVIDQMAGILAANSIVAALLHRERGGGGQTIDTSLLGTALTMFHFHALMGNINKSTFPKHSRTRPGNVLRNYYQCADGQWLICAHNPMSRYWDKCVEVLDLDGATLDPILREEETVRALDAKFATRPRDEWLRLAQEHDLIFAPVNSFADSMKEEQVRANYVDRFDHPELGPFELPAFASRFSGSPLRPRSAAPDLGEHTAQVLVDVGYRESEVEELRRSGVVA